MGLGDVLGSLADGGEHLIDKGKEKLGDAVEWGAHKGGDLLDAAGAHGWADKVEDFGDGIADRLGADVGEQQLGDTDQAGELIHGDPGELRASARHLKHFHKAFDTVGRGMKKLDSSHWRGEGGDAFRKKFTMHPAKWAHAADACKDAASALEGFADTVEWAKKQAQEAIDLYKKGRKASEQAVADYNKKADAYNAKLTAGDDPGPRPEQDMNAGLADVEAAREKLAEARRQRNEAGRTAERTVKAALAHAPAEPPALARLNANIGDFKDAAGMELLHVGGGVLKGAGGLVDQARKFNPIDPYNLTHPAQWFENANMALANAATTAADPEPALRDMWKSAKEDPSEFGGRLLPEAAGGKGAGLLRGGLRSGMRAGEKGLAREGEGLARKHLNDKATDPSDGPIKPENKPERDGTDPVDLVTGRMYLPQTDITLPGTLPLVFTRRLESGSHLGRWFGPSWLSTVDQRLEIDVEGVIFVTEDGLLLTYPHPAPGVPTLPTHGPQRWPLDRVDGGYTVADPHTGRTWHFADRTPDLAVLEQIDDRNGNWITFENDAEGTPLAVTSSGGYRLTLTVEDERVTALSLAGADPDGTDQLIKRYAYSETGDLTQVLDSADRPLTFTYDERGRVTSWTDSNDRSYTYEYDDQDRCIAEGG
ncbi:type IV secretion protein Rhs, partial [Streptomyces sp. SID5785]|uniref:putative T7SS-secreted protein n=1 Tax=Streptomyces sp. SID5785 TaxID=2690309 RepID=UPI0013617BB7